MPAGKMTRPCSISLERPEMPRGGRSTLAELVTVALILGLLAAVIDAPGAAYSAALVDNRVDTTGHAH